MQIVQETNDCYVTVSIPVINVPNCTRAMIDVIQVAGANPHGQLHPETLEWLMEILSQLQISAHQAEAVYRLADKKGFPLT